MNSNEEIESELTDEQRFVVGVTFLIWSLASAVIVGNLAEMINMGMMGFVPGAFLVLIILPPIGAYLVFKSIINTVRPIAENQHTSE